VFARLQQYGLKLKQVKCSFFQEQVKYLGHVISAKGIETDPEKIEAIKSWPVPQNVDQLRTFLGFSGYYRKFVKGYTKLVKPLNDLVTIVLNKGKTDNTLWKWTQQCQDSFDQTVRVLSSPEVLTYPDFQLPFVVNIDASYDGLGATLSQNKDGQEKVVAYASRALRQSEKNYPAHKLEFLALKWAVTDKFHEYLYGNNFTVRTDNNPLTYVTTTAKLDATGHRWLAALSAYNFDITYRSGRKNHDADALSRRPHTQINVEEDREVITADMFRVISSSIVEHNDEKDETTLFETFCNGEDGLDAALENSGFQEDNALPSLSSEEMRKYQENDPVVGKVIAYYKLKKRPTRRNTRNEDKRVLELLKEWDRFQLLQGVIRCKTL